MTWFRRGKKGIKAQPDRKEVPSGVWLKCEECSEILYKPELEKSCWVCGKCNFHFRIGSRQYLDLLLDEGSFVEEDAHLAPADPLHFKDSKRYTERSADAQRKTGLNDAVRAGAGHDQGDAGLDRGAWSSGSWAAAWVGGGREDRPGDRARQRGAARRRHRCPASGGARMQEGIFSLMQMAKTSRGCSRGCAEPGCRTSPSSRTPPPAA